MLDGHSLLSLITNGSKLRCVASFHSLFNPYTSKLPAMRYSTSKCDLKVLFLKYLNGTVVRLLNKSVKLFQNNLLADYLYHAFILILK